jgi:hypothetical protein
MSNSISELDRFRSDSFEPASFRERGATVPFTTPLLLNARIRAATSGRGYEMVVANPSGGRGALIMPWSSMPDICSPTLFDKHLWESFHAAEDISPIGIRHEAQRLAAQGLAGRRAALAAKDAQRRDQAGQRLMRSMLLETLIAASEGPTEAAGRPNLADTASFLKRGERAVARAAALAQMPVAEFTTDLEALAVALSGSAPKIAGEDARLRDMITNLDDLANQVTDWAGDQSEGAPHVLAARFIVETARQTLECAEMALATTDALIADLGLFVPKWRSERDKVIERARGPEWVLDGWKTPIGLWAAADAVQRRSAIWEIALIAPILPREAKAWLGKVSDWRETPRRTTQVVRDKSDWRSGNAMELVARNEHLIGASIAYENRISPMVLPRTQDRLAIRPADTAITSKQTIAEAAPANGRSGRQVDSDSRAAKADEQNPLAVTRSLGNEVEAASDKALLQVVTLVEQLGSPEIHERLLGPSLRRLKRLRPPRPASLTRLMFLPMEGALVEPLQWKRAEGRVPRSALGPLMESLHQASGPQFDALSVQLRGSSLDDHKMMTHLGLQLWSLAANTVPRLRLGSAWSRAGFGQQDFERITQFAASLWRHAGPVWDGLQQVGGDCPPETLRAALIGPANESRLVFVAALETLLQRAKRPSLFLSLIGNLPPQVAGVVEQVLNLWVSTLLPELAEEDFATGARLAAEMGLIIGALEEQPKITARVDAKELHAHRRNLDQFCRSAYREVVSIHVITALLELRSDQTADLAEIEAMARVARSLEETGRRVGPPQPYVAVQEEFRAAAEKLQQGNLEATITAMEIARIEEILIGQESAERSLNRSRRRSGRLQ